MGKGKGLNFLFFSALGAIVGYATYMASKDEFSDDTKDRYDSVVNKLRNVGTDIKRTYTSIGDKEEFTTSTKNLSNSAKKLAEKTGDLLLSATSDMYKEAKNKISNAIANMSDDDSSDFDELDEEYLKKKKTNTKKITTTQKSKKPSTKTKKKK